VRALAANDRDLHLVNLLKTQHVLLAHRDTSEQPCPVALHWPIESPAPPALSNFLLGVLISRCLPSDESADPFAESGGARTRSTKAGNSGSKEATY